MENIGTCPTLNRKGSRHCRRFEVQNKETSTGNTGAHS